jgi:hypothetical protein
LRAILHNGWWLIVSFYLVSDLHLVASQLILIAVAQGIITLLFEIPAGILADTISRKLSLVISHALMGTAMLLTGLATSFSQVVLTQMLWGLSWTFASGADVAWITDEIKNTKRIDLILMRAMRFQFIGAGIGIALFAGIAAIVGRQQAIIAAGMMMLILGMLLSVSFPENGFTPTKTNRIKMARSILKDGLHVVLSDRVVFILFIATISINGAADVFSRAYTSKLEFLGFPLGNDGTIWFGILGLFCFIMSAISMKVIEKGVGKKYSSRLVLILSCGCGALGLVFLALTPILTMGIIGVLISSGIALPVGRAVTTIWLNQRSESRIRATMHSFFSQAESIGEIICGVFIAGVASKAGVSGALISASLLFIIPIVLFSITNND